MSGFGGALLAGGLLASGSPAVAADATAAISTAPTVAPLAAQSDWTTSMHITRPGGCTFYPSLYRKTRPLAAGAWTQPQGHRVGWRYRVNKSWTLVLDYSHYIKGQSRWAFVETSCLKGNKYPPESKDRHGRVRNLYGKASHGRWRHVQFGTTRLRGTRTIGIRTVKAAYITMRDRPGAFATANLFNTNRFKITNRCHGGYWIYGLDVQSRRWGWVASKMLRGNPCRHMN
jgi:hypothetical protein